MRLTSKAAVPALIFCAWFTPVRAQMDAKMPRVGILATTAVSANEANVEAFQRRLRELGYRDGQNIRFEYRHAEARRERLPALAADLVRLKVDAIFAIGTDAALAAKNATKTIPIVFAPVGDPVGAGVVASLAQPGGNITGFTHIPRDLIGKLVGLLKEVAPATTRVAVLISMENPSARFVLDEARVGARSLGVKLDIVDVQRPEDFPAAFSAMQRNKPDALIVTVAAPVDPARVAELAMTARLPAIHERRDFVEAGGLMSYGTNWPEMFRQAAGYIDRVLKGTKPENLPVGQPTSFEFVVNLRTAKVLGLTVPQSMLLRADEIIK